MAKTHKHDYTHRRATTQQLHALVCLLEDIEARGGECIPADLQAIASTLPEGSAKIGTGEYAGLIGWKISWTSTKGHRYFSPFMVAAERLITALGGSVIFNHTTPDLSAPRPKSRLYPQFSFSRFNGSGHVAFGRFTMDAKEREQVNYGHDHYNCSPASLSVEFGSKGVPAREKALRFAEVAYRAAPPEARPFATLEEYMGHIHRAVRLLDLERTRLTKQGAQATTA